MNTAKERQVSICLRRPSAPLCFSPPLSWRRAERFKDLSLTIICNGLHILSVVFKKEALLASNPFSGSTETRSNPSKLVLFSPPHAPHPHQCTLALTLSQPLEGDLFPVRKETGSDSKGRRDWLQQGWAERTVQRNVNTGVTIVLMGRL